MQTEINKVYIKSMLFPWKVREIINTGHNPRLCGREAKTSCRYISQITFIDYNYIDKEIVFK